MITSPSNQHIALLRSLQTKKGRDAEEAFLVEGPHLLEAAMEAHVTPRLIVFDPEHLARTPAGRKALGQIEELRARGAEALDASPVAIERASDTQTPQGVVAAVASEDVSAHRVRARRRGRMRPVLLVLDAVNDPGNMGTILRSALAADVDEVLLAPECADPLSPKVVRAASGAHFMLPIQADRSWQEVSEALAGSPVVGQVIVTEAGAHTPYDGIDLTQRTAVVIGNEAHGVSSQAIRLATQRVRIPMWNKVESLNAAIAASVILFEAGRQRRAEEARSQVGSGDEGAW